VLGAWAALQMGDRNTVEGGALHLRRQSQGKTAGAVYSVPALTGDRPVKLFVDAGRVGADGAYWLGVADYTTYSWEWSGPLAGATTRLLNSDTLRDRYVDRDGTLYYAVVLGSGEVLVKSSTATTSPKCRPNLPYYPLVRECRLGSDKSASMLNPRDQYVTITLNHISAFSMNDSRNEALKYELFRRGPDDAAPVRIGEMSAPIGTHDSPLITYVDPENNAPVYEKQAKPGQEYRYFVRAKNVVGTTPMAPAGSVAIPNYWVRTWGTPYDDGDHAVSDQDGSVYAVGCTYNYEAGLYDVVLLKYDSEGNLLWQRTWGTDSYAHPDNAPCVAADGSVWVSVNSTSGNSALLRFSSDGEQVSQRWRGRNCYTASNPAQSPDGTIYWAGSEWTAPGEPRQTFVVAFSPNGGVRWQRSIVSSLCSVACALLPLDDGVIAAARLGINGDQCATAIVRFDGQGQPSWQRWVTLPANPKYEHLTTLCRADDAFIGTMTLTNYGIGYLPLPYVFKADLDGNLLWQKHWSTTDSVWFSCAQPVDSGSLVILGCRTTTDQGDYPVTVQCDSAGSLLAASTWAVTDPGTTPSMSCLTEPILPEGSSLLFQVGDNMLARWIPGDETMHLATWTQPAAHSASIQALSQGRVVLTGFTQNTWLQGGWTVSAVASEPLSGEWVDGGLAWEPSSGLAAEDTQALIPANGTFSELGGPAGSGTGGTLTMAWDPALIWGN
jgi:hypothetical protein